MLIRPAPFTLALAATLHGCAHPAPPGEATSGAVAALLDEWSGPYGGVPPFDRVRVADFGPALRVAMARQRAEIDAIRDNPEPPTFDNTLLALERSGRALDRVATLYQVWGATLSTPDVRALEQEIEPVLAAHSDTTYQDGVLYARVKVVFQAREALTPEQQRLAVVYDSRFRQSGAELADEPRARVAAINQDLSALYTQFSQNLLADEENYVLFLTSEAELGGLPEGMRRDAAETAKSLGHRGEWAITNTRSSMDPFLTFSARRDLREKVWRTYYGRGDNGDAHDNNALVTQILALRAERAKLLGFATHAHLQLHDSMAATPERAVALMTQVWPMATSRAREELEALQAVANAEGADFALAAWDWRYYAEKVRRQTYRLDQNEVKPYLQLEKLREGMFWAAGELFGWQFRPALDVPVAHRDIRVWEVLDADGSHRGLWYFDPFARAGKQSGAWMNGYRTQEGIDGSVHPIVSNNANFVKAAPGEPVLVSWDDAETLFHEFGHALHGLASNVTYPTLSGTAVARDFVEFPSQINERWLSTPEILSRFAMHYETGEPMPKSLVDRIEAARHFNQGFATTEYLASALIDMKLHLAGSTPIDPAAFEREELAKLGMPEQIVMRHRTPQFGHVFSGDGYSAGYYSYLWADTLTADAAEAFVEAGGFYDAASAKRYLDTVLSVGNTLDPSVSWQNFRGRDVAVEPWLREKGFAATP